MSDKITPPMKAIGKRDGLTMGSDHMTITTPDPTYGRYFGADVVGAQAVNSTPIMGKKK